MRWCRGDIRRQIEFFDPSVTIAPRALINPPFRGGSCPKSVTHVSLLICYPCPPTIPYDKVESRQRPELLDHSEHEIFSTYNAELRGLTNYYCLAFDAKRRLNRLFYIAQKSLVKTLANKYRTKASEIILRRKEGKDYVYRYRVNGE